MNINRLRSRLRQTVGQLKHKIFPGTLILMYHRVAEVHSDPWSLCVTPQHFAEHLEVLRKHTYPIPLQELTKKLHEHQSIRRSVVITFDDGYADNLHNARPLLEKYDVPATVFVTTGGIEQDREFWWDELDRLLLQPGRLPDSLELKLNGSYYQWELGKAAQYTESDCQHCHHWNALQENFPTPRHFLYYSLYQLLYPLPTDKRQEVLDELRRWAKSEPGGRSTHRSLTNKELLALDQGELIEVGAHTVTHPFLSKLPEALQRDEIQQSKDYLEKILGHTVMSFSYPNGDYTEDTISIVQEAGFTCACSSVVGRVYSDSNHFLLPRVVVEDWDGETLARWLSQLSFL